MATKKTYKKKAIPKHLWGALLSTGAGLITSSIAANKANKAQKAAELKSKQANYTENLTADTFEAEQYQENLKDSITGYYNKGGKLATPTFQTKGGKLKKLSSDMVVAKGNTHEESSIDNTSGIKLIKNGKAFAEIEDEETIKDGKKVYSDRLTVDGNVTFAKAAANLAKKKSAIENSNSNNSQVKKIDAQEDALFKKQESMKKAKKLTNVDGEAKFGDWLKETFKSDGKVAKGVTKALPFIDNIGNAIINSKTPKIPAPSLDRVKDRKTNINVNPQLASIDSSVASTTDFIKNNTSNSNVARANVASTKIKGANAKANILSTKENQETQLQNANQAQQQATVSRNNAKIDNFNLMNVQRTDAISRRSSANLANLSDDFIRAENNKRTENYQNKTLDVLSKQTHGGVGTRALLNTSPDVIKQNPKMFWNAFKSSAEKDAFLKLVGMTEEQFN